MQASTQAMRAFAKLSHSNGLAMDSRRLARRETNDTCTGALLPRFCWTITSKSQASKQWLGLSVKIAWALAKLGKLKPPAWPTYFLAFFQVGRNANKSRPRLIRYTLFSSSFFLASSSQFLISFQMRASSTTLAAGILFFSHLAAGQSDQQTCTIQCSTSAFKATGCDLYVPYQPIFRSAADNFAP